MEKYYYIENETQHGPFSIEDLKSKRINRETLVWTETMENWVQASSVEELKDIVKKTPPPIPKRAENPIKVEAEISHKKEKLITPEREILIAKETKTNFKLVLISFVIGLISIIYFISEKNGFSNKLIADKLQNDYEMSSIYNDYTGKEKEQLDIKRQELKTESSRLGYYFDEDNIDINKRVYFSTFFAIKYHKEKFYSAIRDAILPSLISILISSMILILGRYFWKSKKWVEANSKK